MLPAAEIICGRRSTRAAAPGIIHAADLQQQMKCEVVLVVKLGSAGMGG